MNEIHIIGRVGKEPEIKEFEAGKTAKFTIADSQGKEHTEWFNCVAFKATADTVAKYVKKGDLLHVCGKIHTNEYEKDGEKKRFTEVLVNNVTLIQPREKSDNSMPPTNQRPPVPITETADDLPF